MKKIRLKDLTLEMKKDISMQVVGISESPEETARKYNITITTLNKIIKDFFNEEIKETDDGVIDIVLKEAVNKIPNIKN